MNIFFANKIWIAYCFILLLSLNLFTIQAAGWQRHEAPSTVWQIEPIIENGVQIGLLLGCQDNHVYSLSPNGDIEWSFDTKGQPSQIISHDLDGDGTAEVIVATYDDDGSLYILSDKGVVLKSYQYGMPFSSIGLSPGNNRIYGVTFDCQLLVFDYDLNLLKKDVWDKPNPSSWYQALKVGDVTGDGEDEVVVLNMQGTINVFSAEGTLLKREKVGGSSKRGDLFLVDINDDAKKEMIVISAGVVHENYAVEYKNDALNTLFTFQKLGSSASMTIIDDFLPTEGLDILCFDPHVHGTNVYVNALTATGTWVRNRKEIKKEKMHLPLCVKLSANKETIIAGSVGTRDKAYYTISSSDFQDENYPLLPEVNYSAPALQTLANAVQSIHDKGIEGDQPYVLFLRGYVNQYNYGNMAGWGQTMRKFEELAPHVKVVIEFPVDTKSKMTRQELMDFTDKLEREGVPFTYEMSSGSSPSDISLDEMEEVLKRAPTMCYGFATTENARYARNPNDPWKKVFFPMVLQVAELCKAHGKTINVQENMAGWAVYAGDPDVISQWFSPELKGTIIPIVRNNSNGAYLAINALLGLEAAGFSDGWGVSIQDWMWVDQGKHLIAGMIPRELMTRSNMMAAALGARYFQFEAGNFAMEDMMKITANPDSPRDLHEDAVFFQYLRKGLFQGYYSSDIKNFSTHAIGLEYNDDLWLTLQNDWFLGLWNFNMNSDINSGVLGQHTGLQPLPEKNVYKHLYGVKYNRATNFKTPYGLVPIVPSPYPVRGGAKGFQLLKTDRHVYLDDDVKYENAATLLETFESGILHQPFRTADANMTVYKHKDGYLLYLVGADYFTVDDGPVSIQAHEKLSITSVEDYVTGEEVEQSGNTIETSIPGGVIRILYVQASGDVGINDKAIKQKDKAWLKLKPSKSSGHIGLVLERAVSADMDVISLDGKLIDRFMLQPGDNNLYSSYSRGMVLLRISSGQWVETHKYIIN